MIFFAFSNAWLAENLVNAAQFLPQDHLHVMMQLSTNILFIYQTEKTSMF